MASITDKGMQAKPTDKDQWLTSPFKRGAGVFVGRITPNGERLLYFRYTNSLGKRQSLPIGPYHTKGTKGYTLADAYAKACELSELYRSGIKDIHKHFELEREKEKAAEAHRILSEKNANEAEALDKLRRISVKKLYERWASVELQPQIRADGRRTGRKDGGKYTFAQFERRLFPSLGDVDINAIRKSDLVAILDKAKSEGKRRTCNMLLADMKQMFRFAHTRELIASNPLDTVSKKEAGGSDVARIRTLSVDELIALRTQLKNANLSKRTEIAVRLILATGCRIGELSNALWKNVDLVNRTWFLSEAFHKSSGGNRRPYSFGCIQRVVKAAESLGWIGIFKGNHFLNGGQVSRIRAAGELARVFQAHPFGWTKMATPAPSELIVMSSGKKKKIRRFVRPDEHSEIQTWQRNLNQINELLTSKCIHLDTTNENIRLAAVAQAKKSSKEFIAPINFPKVSLRRIFARDRFDCGGRFYGGWWQYTPSAFRPYVSIDGEITVESDYSGMALNCLYALFNEQQGEGDPYDIGLNYLNESDPRRKLVKKYINAILNDEHNKFRLSHDELCTLGISSRELHARVVRRHPKIAKYFNTGIGLHLQFVESEIAQNVMMSFLQDSEACLPIHDSFIVRHQQIEKLEYVMQDSFQRQFNSKIKIKSENLFLGERMAAPNPDLIPQGLPYKEQASTFYQVHNSRVSMSFDYYAGWVMATQTLDEINARYGEAVQWWQANRESVRASIHGHC